MAKDQERILLTKDHLLAELAQKNNVNTVNISDDELDQFSQIKDEVGLEMFAIEGKISQCTVCNGMLFQINKGK